MGLILIRFLFVFLSTLLGYYVSTQLYDQVGKAEGMAIGFGVAVLIILTEFLFRRVSLKVIVGGILGFILGLMSASISDALAGRASQEELRVEREDHGRQVGGRVAVASEVS